MKISIITACYNNEDTIVRTIESVREQSYHDVEHIFVDGASKDNTLSIIRELAPASVIVSEKDDGIYDALNKGIALATGDVIGILHADDFYAGPTILADVAAMMQNSKAEALYGDLLYVDRLNTNKVIRTWRSGRFGKNSFLWGWMPPHPTFFVKKEVYERLGVFNTRLRSAADYELMLRLMHKNRIKTVYLKKVLVKMRTGGQSNVTLSNRVKANKEDRMAWTLNGLRPYWFTRYIKPLRKISQYLKR